MSKAPGWKSADVGYWNVPGPLSSPLGSVVSKTGVPVIVSDATLRWSYAVSPWIVAVVVRTEVPKVVGTTTSKAPDLSAVTAATTVAAPVSVLVAATTTRARGAVVPVTWVVAVGAVAPFAGAVTVS